MCQAPSQYLVVYNSGCGVICHLAARQQGSTPPPPFFLMCRYTFISRVLPPWGGGGGGPPPPFFYRADFLRIGTLHSQRFQRHFFLPRFRRCVVSNLVLCHRWMEDAVGRVRVFCDASGFIKTPPLFLGLFVRDDTSHCRSNPPPFSTRPLLLHSRTEKRKPSCCTLLAAAARSPLTTIFCRRSFFFFFFSFPAPLLTSDLAFLLYRTTPWGRNFSFFFF